MPGRKRKCPCGICLDKEVTYNTWKTHHGEMATGRRTRRATSAWQVGADTTHQENPQADGGSANEDQSEVGRGMALDLVELVGRGDINQQGLDAVLKVVSTRLGGYLPISLGVPSSWYQARKRAMEGGGITYTIRDFCPVCDFLFPESTAVTRCERCDKSTRVPDGGKCKRQAPYFHLADLVRRMFLSPVTARALRYGLNTAPMTAEPVREREMCDAFDGSIIPDLVEGNDFDRDSTLFFSFSCDGVEVRKKTSLTPLSCKCLSLPPKLRGLLGSIWLLGFLPPKVKDYKSFLRPVFEQFRKHAPGNEAIVVSDASNNGAVRRVYVVLAWTVNDVRGLPTVTCGHHPPCYIGPCNMCKVQGARPLKMPGSVVLPGAVRALGRGT
jgi:hypothetical protein